MVRARLGAPLGAPLLIGRQLVIALVLFLPAGPCFCGTPVTIEMGLPGDLVREQVETNLASVAGLPASGDPVRIPPAAAAPAPASGDPLANAVKKRFPHLFEAAAKVLPKWRARSQQLPEVLEDTGAANADPGSSGPGPQVRGPGTVSVTAKDDGEVTITTVLRTFAAAFQEVRLYDPDGVEVTFDGRPLLSWRRPDDKAYAPVEFKGQPDKDSMVQVKGGDYSPRDGLSYTFFLKKGQKIVLKTGGKALPASFLSLDGSNL